MTRLFLEAVYACIDCYSLDDFDPRREVETGDFLDCHDFARFPCDICGSKLEGARVAGSWIARK